MSEPCTRSGAILAAREVHKKYGPFPRGTVLVLTHCGRANGRWRYQTHSPLETVADRYAQKYLFIRGAATALVQDGRVLRATGSNGRPIQ